MAGEIAQKDLWNGRSGNAWVAEQALLDRLLQPFEAVLVDAVVDAQARAVLDVGCGTGATTLAIARMLGERGRCTGIDISEPMVALARSRAEQQGVAAEFILADAQDHALPPSAFDLIVSRFGVMFFEDPVAAFANLRKAAQPGAGLRFVAWRGAADNAFMTTAERAAAPFLPDLPPRRRDGPGQFGFGDRERVTRILVETGWSDIALAPLDRICTMTEPELANYYTRLGPVAAMLDEVDSDGRARILEAMRTAFAPFVEDGIARFTAACWSVSARA